MHILLVRFSSMGDVVLTTATINWLHALLGEGLKLSFVTSQEFTSLVDGHPGISHVIGFDRRKGESWKDLTGKVSELHRQHKIDLIIDLHATLRSFRLRCSFWSVPALTVDKRRWERFFLTKIPVVAIKKLFSQEPQVIRILRDFESIFDDHRAERRTRDYRKGPHGELTSLKTQADSKLSQKYIVLAPSASFLYKRWPVQSFVELAQDLLDKTSHEIVVLAGKDDSFCEAFETIKDSRFHNLQGKTTLSESMSYLKSSLVSIGNDSGMNHIAEAYGVPCVSIFGPTDPRFGFAPHGSSSITLSKELWCKPCSTTGKKPCFRERHFCMEMISVKEVSDAAVSILEKRP